MNLGVASRFALLKIDDDDEEDGDGIVRGQPSSKNKKPAHHGKTKFVPFGSSSVNNATSQKQQKKKNGKKHKVRATAVWRDGFGEGEWEAGQCIVSTLQVLHFSFLAGRIR